MNWNKKIRFKDLLEEFDDDNDELEEIKRIRPIWVERLKSIKELHDFIPQLKKVKTLTQFNKWLDEIYDYCDYEGIWVE